MKRLNITAGIFRHHRLVKRVFSGSRRLQNKPFLKNDQLAMLIECLARILSTSSAVRPVVESVK